MNKGYTLAELLIVVSVIGIMAAIAVPQYLNAQVKAKIARCLANMQSIGQALEVYFMDKSTYPRWAWDRYYQPAEHYKGFRDLTTPIRYIDHSAMFNPFISAEQRENYETFDGLELDPFFEMGTYKWDGYYLYPYPIRRTKFPKNVWLLESSGPDQGDNYDTKIYPHLTLFYHTNDGPIYQSSNGLYSRGDIFRGGGVFVAEWVKNARY